MKRIDPTLCGNLDGDHFGQRMLAAREHAGLDRKVAAGLVGLSSKQLGRIEAGAVGMVSDPATLVKAAKAYGVSDVWLYAGGVSGERLTPPLVPDAEGRRMKFAALCVALLGGYAIAHRVAELLRMPSPAALAFVSVACGAGACICIYLLTRTGHAPQA